MFKSYLKTGILLAILTALLLFIGNLIGGYSGLIIAGIFVLLMNFGSYFFSDKIVLWMYHAKPAGKLEYLWLHKIVEELAKKSRLPKPKLYIIPLKISNAFATGRGPKHSAVAVTEGIIRNLSKDELRGVLAHELAHIKNRDVLIMTIAATIAGTISYIASMARWAAIFGTGRDNEGNNLISLLVLAIVAPIAALLIQLAISRTREYAADESGARIIGDGIPLANALLKLEEEAKTKPLRASGYESTAHLFIVNPFRGGFASLFSTHPPITLRVEKLRKLKFD
ncbi:MAG: zinc metalloprotease HtpX [Candidatus Pacearchaeota archaeon]